MERMIIKKTNVIKKESDVHHSEASINAQTDVTPNKPLNLQNGLSEVPSVRISINKHV